MKILFFIVLSGFALNGITAQPMTEKRLALVIGNGNYAHGSTLPNALNDATDMAAALTKVGFEVIVHKNTDRATMQRVINEFGTKLKGYQTGLVYYAGHGIEMNEQQFLVPADANPTKAADVGAMCVLTNQLIASMALAKARTNIIVLDADRTNPFSDTLRRNSGGYVETPIGFIVAHATSPGQVAIEGTGRNGLYTSALLKAMVIPNQTLVQIFTHVRADVLQRSQNKQMPWESTSLTEDFYLVRK